MRYFIKFNNLDDVEHFVATVNGFECDFNVCDDLHCVDGKSIVAMANLDLKKIFYLEAITDDENLLSEIETAIYEYIL